MIKFFVRMTIIAFWLILVGIGYSVFSSVNNFSQLGWPTFLFYAVLAISVVYGGISVSKQFWSVK